MKRAILILIVILGVILRLFQITNYPSGFHIDEVTLGYNSYSILSTGRDETGKLLPLYSQSFGLDRALGNFLLVGGFIKIFGLNELSVRLPFVVFGILTILLVYYFSYEIYPKKKYALISAFLLAVSSWHIDIVRASSEASVSLFLIILGQWLFLKSIRGNRKKLLLISLLCLIISVFFYHVALGFVLISIPIMLIFSLKQFQEKKIRILYSAYSLIIIISLLLFIYIGKGGIARFEQVGFINDPEVKFSQQKMFYEEGNNNVFKARIFHNKIFSWIRAITNNYSEYFSINYLLLNAGKPPRYTPPQMGLIYFLELPLLLIGIYYIIQKKSVNLKLIIIMLVISPLIAAFTYEYSPNVQRSFFMVVYIEMITAFGLTSFYLIFRKNKLLLSAFILLFSLNIVYYLHQYYVHYPVHDPLFRNDGVKELVSNVSRVKDEYATITITNDPEQPYHYFLFYNKYDPDIFQKKYSGTRSNNQGWLFEDKIYFSSQRCPSEKSDIIFSGRVLYIDNGQCAFYKDSNKFNLVKTIVRKDGSIIYRLLEDKIL